MNLSRLNLNLLTALDALLTEINVTKAGKKLFISQSAMSNLLKQLREVLQDPLLVRGMASSMTLTPRAQALQIPVKEALAKVSAVFATAKIFDPKTARHTFTIGMSDYIELVLVAPLIRQILKTAPGVDIIIKHVNFIGTEDIRAMEEDKLDLVLGLQQFIPEPLVTEELFEDQAVCVGWSKNPLLKKPLSFKNFAEAPQVMILFAEDKTQSYSEQLLSKAGYERRIVALLPHTLAAMQILPNTPLIATVMKLVVKKMAKDLDLTFQPVPFSYPKLMVTQAWHPKHSMDSAHIWLRETIKKVAKIATKLND